VHIVLVPGFAGFDALGQLEYYAGVTPLFHDWKKARTDRAHVVLHYFDNFPTAAVETRAMRLRDYLAKRVARGTFMPEDEVVLVGHSTGGLDIRRLIWCLAKDPNEKIPVDGDKDHAVPIQARVLLDLIKRVVFLSVPQRGTNIADWVRSYYIGQRLVVAQMRAAVEASQIPFIDLLQEFLVRRATVFAASQLLFAIQDSLNEADSLTGSPTPMRVASAQEAASQLALWLRHMASDFSAIDDLAAQPPKDSSSSPAHFDEEDRQKEKKYWRHFKITTRSYATVGTRPYHFSGRAPEWNLVEPWTYPDCGVDEEVMEKTDIAYRACYRACAGGPFKAPEDSTAATYLGTNEKCKLEDWDNDGIVNTASMLWPDGIRTQVVKGDHMDIVGHYRLRYARKENGRRFQAYDLLGSASDFEETFRRLWSDVFEFALSASTTVKTKTRRLRPPARVRRRVLTPGAPS
jgi:hypothetical protein